MKKVLFFLALLVPVIANAMKIEKDEIDEFTGNRTVITSWEGLNKNYIHIRFRSQNGNEYLDFKLVYDDAIVISEGGKLMFKSTTDDITEFNSISQYMGTKGGGAVGLNGSGMWGIKATYRGDLAWFGNNITKLMRIYATHGYIDKKISDSDGRKLVKLYELFTNTLNNQQGVSVYANYSLTFVKKSASKKEWDVVNEEYKKDITKEELAEIIKEWKDKSDGNTIYDVKIKKEK